MFYKSLGRLECGVAYAAAISTAFEQQHVVVLRQMTRQTTSRCENFATHVASLPFFRVFVQKMALQRRYRVEFSIALAATGPIRVYRSVVVNKTAIGIEGAPANTAPMRPLLGMLVFDMITKRQHRVVHFSATRTGSFGLRADGSVLYQQCLGLESTVASFTAVRIPVHVTHVFLKTQEGRVLLVTAGAADHHIVFGMFQMNMHLESAGCLVQLLTVRARVAIAFIGGCTLAVFLVALQYLLQHTRRRTQVFVDHLRV